MEPEKQTGWSKADQYMPLPCLPCSQKRMIAVIRPSWGVSNPCWRLNEKLLYSYFYADPKFVF